jgi:hypothetical protein
MVVYMNPIIQDVSRGYKHCAGKGCQNEGFHCLKVVFVNRVGWFCDSCKSSLIADNLCIEQGIFLERSERHVPI